MRHRKTGVKLNRTTSHRQAMFRNMVTSLLKHERIRTTDVKAKELRKWADHIITLAKRGDMHARRQALSIVREKDVVHKLFAEAANRFGSINGGYTRIVKIGHRPGDAAPISLIELISVDEKTKKSKKKAKTAAKKPAKASAAAAKKEAAKEVPVTEPEVEAETKEAAPEVPETESDDNNVKATAVEEEEAVAAPEAESQPEEPQDDKEAAAAPVEEASAEAPEAETKADDAADKNGDDEEKKE